MKGVVFNSYLSMLVNGRTTKDFKATRGLRQGDPLSPFLFAIVAECLAYLVMRVGNRNMLTRVNLNVNTSVNLLQFADDTVITCDNSWSNLWGLKSILRGFELISGLKINLWKNYLYGIRVEESFLMEASKFFACKTGLLPLKFLGLTIGGKHRRVYFWKLIIDCIKARLSSWKYCYYQLEERWRLLIWC